MAIGAIYLWRTTAIPLDPWAADEAFTSRTLPYVYGVLLMGLGLLLIGARRSIPATRERLRVLGLLLSVAAFAGLIEFIGPWWSLAGLLAVCLVTMGERRVWMIAGVSATLPLVGWLVVSELLGVRLPGVG